jgi:hypothetical protein
MNRDQHLNNKATMAVIEDLMRGGLVKRSITRDRPDGLKKLHVDMTAEGTHVVAAYANALRFIRRPTKRKIQMFNDFLTLQASNYMREIGWSS